MQAPLEIKICIVCNKQEAYKGVSYCYECKNKKYPHPGYNARRKQYNQENRESILEYDRSYQHKRTKYVRDRRSKDINFKLLHNTRVRINKAVKYTIKKSTAIESLGCEIDFYRKYIENKWTKGMCWDNYGEWEIDHILPVSKGGSFHYTNTQPLWLGDNRQKSNKI